MKKIICLVLIFTMMLTACSKWNVEIVDPTEPSESQAEVPFENELKETNPGESCTLPEDSKEKYAVVFEDENGKFGFKTENGEIIVEAIYDEILTSNEEVWSGFEAKFTDGTRPTVEHDEYMTPYLTEEPNVKTVLFDKNGEKIIDIAFEEVIVEKNPSGGEGIWILGVENGINYRFIEENGEFVLNAEEKPRSVPDENGFGYTINTYCYDWYAGYRDGISLGDKVIFEPVYFGVSVPFKDRIIVSDGTHPLAGPECRVKKIIDPEGNVISRVFNGIEYSFFEDGEKYIGIAYSNGNDCEVPLYEGEERLPQGYWFVDKDGKIISERFDHLPYPIENIEELLIVEDEEGNKIEINVKDFLLEA